MKGLKGESKKPKLSEIEKKGGSGRVQRVGDLVRMTGKEDMHFAWIGGDL